MKNLISVGTLEAESNDGQDGSVAKGRISAIEIVTGAAGTETM
jgi:hypothetical protein